MFNQRLWL